MLLELKNIDKSFGEKKFSREFRLSQKAERRLGCSEETAPEKQPLSVF